MTDEQVAAAHAARDTARAAMERGDKSFGTQFVAEALTKLLADREYFGCDPLSRISAIIDRNILERMGRKIGDQSYKRNSEVLHSAERFPWCVADAPRAMRSESAIAAARAAIPPSVWRARASTSAATVSSPSPTPALSPVAMPPLPPTLPAASASAAMPPLPPALSDLAPAFPPLPARGGSGGGTGSGFSALKRL